MGEYHAKSQQRRSSELEKVHLPLSSIQTELGDVIWRYVIWRHADMRSAFRLEGRDLSHACVFFFQNAYQMIQRCQHYSKWSSLDIHSLEPRVVHDFRITWKPKWKGYIRVNSDHITEHRPRACKHVHFANSLSLSETFLYFHSLNTWFWAFLFNIYLQSCSISNVFSGVFAMGVICFCVKT